ncbi:MAG: aminoglycoside phosphotransferase family protein [Oligoflexales bacterium]
MIGKDMSRYGTSVDIDLGLVCRLIADQFPEWDGLEINPVEVSGWDNRTFRLGDQLLVRMPSAARYSAQVAKEQRWLPKLAPHLPLPIPVPVALGRPSHEYPWNWSVYRWIDGEAADAGKIDDLDHFAHALSAFLVALQKVDATDGPTPGQHNFFRGGALKTYDDETRGAIAKVRDRIDSNAALAVWEDALATTWDKGPVWVHGDVSAGNLLHKGGKLSAVIDFGCIGVGDPACDLAIAWTFFSGKNRESFLHGLQPDPATLARGRGWTLWKALITLAQDQAPVSMKCQRIIGDLLE